MQIRFTLWINANLTTYLNLNYDYWSPQRAALNCHVCTTQIRFTLWINANLKHVVHTYCYASLSCYRQVLFSCSFKVNTHIHKYCANHSVKINVLVCTENNQSINKMADLKSSDTFKYEALLRYFQKLFWSKPSLRAQACKLAQYIYRLSLGRVLVVRVATRRRPLTGDDAAVVTSRMLSCRKLPADLVRRGSTHTAPHFCPLDGGL